MSREALITGTATQLSRAIAFLSDDCTPAAGSNRTPYFEYSIWLVLSRLLCFSTRCDRSVSGLIPPAADDAMGYGTFWWEPLEMLRKLFLTGAVLLIEHAEQARVLVALLSSVSFLALQLSVNPHKRCAACLHFCTHIQSEPHPKRAKRFRCTLCGRRPEDGWLMTLIFLALILVYTCALLIKSCELSPAVCITFGFGQTAKGEALRRVMCMPQSLTFRTGGGWTIREDNSSHCCQLSCTYD
eukprot:5288013-Prymnesium_polylepis.1